MGTALWMAYLATALAVAGVTLWRLAAERPLRYRDTAVIDTVILMGTALLASAAWALLLPVYLWGWTNSAAGRATRARVRARMARLTPEPIFRRRLYQSLR